MPFILNNVRKPKSVGKVFLKSGNRGNGFNAIALKNALIGRCLINHMAANVNEIFSKEDLEIIKKLKNDFNVSEKPQKVCLMFGSYDRERDGVECSIYFIEIKHLLLDKCKFSRLGLISDTVFLDSESWIENKNVGGERHQIFFDKHEEKLVIAINPKDIDELNKNPNMIFIGESDAEENGDGEITLKNITSLKVLKFSDSENLESEKK